MSAALPPLPPAYAEFLRLFARGDYWHAHEALEQAWRANHSGFYKGMILLASAWVHAGRGNAHGVRAQLEKAARELAAYDPVYMGQDVAGLLALVARARDLMPAEVAASPPDLTPGPARFRGHEPELAAG